MSTPTIAIVGRPNVGKSTLFNRITRKRKAITSDIAGTTRDRITQLTDIEGYRALLVDTGGLEDAQGRDIEEDIQTQANIAIAEADLVIFTLDISNELTPDDYAATDILRKSKKPIILVANKCDNPQLEERVYGLYELGFGEAIKVSAIHKLGIETLLTEIADNLKKLSFKKADNEEEHTSTPEIGLCILGKPNAGKSSLINGLLGSDRLIVSDIAGTTRDSIDSHISYQDKNFNLIDTAGLRRRGKIERGIEKYSALRAMQGIERSDIVILLMDGNLGITSQDTHIVSHALEAQKGIILAVNKLDLFEEGEEDRERVLRQLQKKFPFIPWAPVVFISAKNKKNIFKILDLSIEIKQEREKRIKTAQLNTFFQKITFKHMPASSKVRKPKFMYATQVAIDPPTFTLFFKNPGDLHFSYPRYLENQIRSEYGFTGTSINLKFKNRAQQP
ncbi:ribosome biogenesis GTPase Der [Candidatus Peregrinibacteria bacterium HGW-Peregrinibacteria-1]|jgi:GTP-binding protein|nr:MAG: ribosome biogenesis GTPase Der [Candidatus Peregrinibacteria bacterium HGW-Peregrinibacteria-1]